MRINRRRSAITLGGVGLGLSLALVPSAAMAGQSAGYVNFGGTPKVYVYVNASSEQLCVQVVNSVSAARSRFYVKGTDMHSGTDFGGDQSGRCESYPGRNIGEYGTLVVRFTGANGVEQVQEVRYDTGVRDV